MNIAFLLFDGITPLDAIWPFDASRIEDAPNDRIKMAPTGLNRT
jgi:hypothetical protein